MYLGAPWWLPISKNVSLKQIVPALKCFRCQPGQDCFKDGLDGTSVDCVSPDNTACYKVKVGEALLKFW